VENTKETGPTEQPPASGNPSAGDSENLSEEIMNLLCKRTPNPSEAFVMLQQLCVFLWEQYRIDWGDQPGIKVAESRKQRYLDFVSGLIDSLLSRRD
jgi:hypothetical protein